MNEKKREYESQAKVLEIQSLLIGKESINVPHRRWVKDGDFSELVNGLHQHRHLFLFNDTLLVTQPKKSQYRFLWMEEASKLFVESTPGE